MSSKQIGYSYLSFPVIDSETNQTVGEVFRPYIPIRISFNRGQISPTINALADSGADRNLFPAQWGEELGLNFKKIKPTLINGIGKSVVKAYPAKVNIWLNGLRYETDADFCYEQQIPLLGRNGFFNLFSSLNFKENEKFLYITF